MDSYPYYNKGNTFYFTTNKGINYTIEFYQTPEVINVDYHFLDIHTIVFWPDVKHSALRKDKKYGKDELISITITKIIEYFLADSDSPILFICDSIEIGSLERYRLFQSWYRQYRHKDIKTIFRSYNAEVTYYSGIIYRSNHPFEKQILELLDNPDILHK